MKRIVEVQKNYIEINAKFRGILQKLKKFSRHDIENFFMNNMQTLAVYGKAFFQMVQYFGLYAFYNNANVISQVWNRIEQGEKLSEIGIDAQDLAVAMNDIAEAVGRYENKVPKKCCVCDNEVYYLPLPSYYEEQHKKYGSKVHVSETLNKTEYTCPFCGASDRDRLITSFLKKLRLDEKNINEKMLQIAPAKSIEHWVNRTTTSVIYESTDLYMDGVSFKSDIQNMENVEDNSYDYIICSHVLEHVQDDRKAMKELYRILKEDGIIVFLVPICLDIEEVDEEWGLSKEENWKRFVQDDHCRRYSKQGVIDRLEDTGFCVHQLGIEYFGKEMFNECGLIDSSVLYILSKQKEDIDSIIRKKILKREKQERKYPLVSVIMSTYNHEEYVARAIESVLNQTYKNIEFIIADDCSTDGTVEVLKKYENKVKKIYYFDTNAVGRGRFLLTKVTGKYAALINSDDYWMPDKIEKQVDYMTTHPDCGACFTGGKCVDEKGNITDYNPFLMDNKNKEEWMKHFFKNRNCLCHPSVMIEPKLYLELMNGIGTRLYRQLPDFMMWVKLVQEKEIHIIEQGLVGFTFHENGNNRNSSARTAKNSIVGQNEIMHIWYHIIRNMKFDYFIKAFKAYMIDENISTEEELKCEKFLLLYNSENPSIKMASLLYLYDIYDCNICKLLEEKYHLSRNQLNEFESTVAVCTVE